METMAARASVTPEQMETTSLVVDVPVTLDPASAVIPEKKYLLTVRMWFAALDDMEARKKAKGKLELLGINDSIIINSPAVQVKNEGEIKLQEVRKDGPPRKVEL